MRANQFSRSSNIRAGCQRQCLHKRRTTLIGTGVATPQPHVAVAGEGTADGGQVGLVFGHVFQAQGTGAEAHFTRAAVGHDVDRLNIITALNGARHLRRGRLAICQHNRLKLWAQTGQQGVEVGNVAVDKDDFFGV